MHSVTARRKALAVNALILLVSTIRCYLVLEAVFFRLVLPDLRFNARPFLPETPGVLVQTAKPATRRTITSRSSATPTPRASATRCCTPTAMTRSSSMRPCNPSAHRPRRRHLRAGRRRQRRGLCAAADPRHRGKPLHDLPDDRGSAADNGLFLRGQRHRGEPGLHPQSRRALRPRRRERDRPLPRRAAPSLRDVAVSLLSGRQHLAHGPLSRRILLEADRPVPHLRGQSQHLRHRREGRRDAGGARARARGRAGGHSHRDRGVRPLACLAAARFAPAPITVVYVPSRSRPTASARQTSPI